MMACLVPIGKHNDQSTRRNTKARAKCSFDALC